MYEIIVQIQQEQIFDVSNMSTNIEEDEYEVELEDEKTEEGESRFLKRD